jgi:uncharacterized protein (DUF342 family)
LSDREKTTGSWTTAFLSSAPDLRPDPGIERPPDRDRPPEDSDAPLALVVLGDLDRTVGSVSHPGPVRVRGHVQPELTVFAGGTIRVEGDVRGARLISGDRIEVDGSVGGPGASQLDALGDVVVGSARLADITAGGDVRCRHSMVQCRVLASGRVVLDGIPGHLSGGSIHAAQGVRARRIGSGFNRATEIRVGEAVTDEDAESLARRLRLCVESGSRASRRLEEICARFDALAEGRASAVQSIQRLVRERVRTQRLQASLVRRRRQAGAGGERAGLLLQAGEVLSGVTLDDGQGPHPLIPRNGAE